MTFNKIKISFLMAVLSISLATIVITQSFAQENDSSQEEERNNAIDQQMNLFSNNVKLGEKIPLKDTKE